MVGWDTKEFAVTVNGDSLVESDEYVAIEISDVTGAVYDAGFGDPYGRLDDLGPFPTFRVDGHGVSEGDGGLATSCSGWHLMTGATAFPDPSRSTGRPWTVPLQHRPTTPPRVAR